MGNCTGKQSKHDKRQAKEEIYKPANPDTKIVTSGNGGNGTKQGVNGEISATTTGTEPVVKGLEKDSTAATKLETKGSHTDSEAATTLKAKGSDVHIVATTEPKVKESDVCSTVVAENKVKGSKKDSEMVTKPEFRESKIDCKHGKASEVDIVTTPYSEAKGSDINSEAATEAEVNGSNISETEERRDLLSRHEDKPEETGKFESFEVKEKDSKISMTQSHSTSSGTVTSRKLGPKEKSVEVEIGEPYRYPGESPDIEESDYIDKKALRSHSNTNQVESTDDNTDEKQPFKEDKKPILQLNSDTSGAEKEQKPIPTGKSSNERRRAKQEQAAG